MLSPRWRDDFRIPQGLFYELIQTHRTELEKSNTSLRHLFRPEIHVAAFLLFVGGRTTQKWQVSRE